MNKHRFWKECIHLLRLHQPAAYILIASPIIWLLAMSEINWPHLAGYSIFFIFGSCVMRSAGCVLNDIVDRNIDSKVRRTKHRPIAKGAISVPQALIILVGLMTVALSLLLLLPNQCLAPALIALALLFIYPYAKRHTYYPQLVLAATFNMGIWIAWMAIEARFSFIPVLVYIAACFWTVAYDTIYGYQDYDDDLAHNVKSLAVKLGPKGYDVIRYCYHTFITLMGIAGLNSYMNLSFFIILGLTVYLIESRIMAIDISDSKSCAKAFRFNIYIGLLLILATICGRMI